MSCILIRVCVLHLITDIVSAWSQAKEKKCSKTAYIRDLFQAFRREFMFLFRGVISLSLSLSLCVDDY